MVRRTKRTGRQPESRSPLSDMGRARGRVGEGAVSLPEGVCGWLFSSVVLTSLGVLGRRGADVDSAASVVVEDATCRRLNPLVLANHEDAGPAMARVDTAAPVVARVLVRW